MTSALIAKIEKSKKMSVLTDENGLEEGEDANEDIDEELEIHRKSRTRTRNNSRFCNRRSIEYEKKRRSVGRERSRERNLIHFRRLDVVGCDSHARVVIVV